MRYGLDFYILGEIRPLNGESLLFCFILLWATQLHLSHVTSALTQKFASVSVLSCTDEGRAEHEAKKLQQPMVCHSVDGVYRVEGETWPLDACTWCLCHLGRVLCATHQCPPAPCPQPVYQPGQCCARCPESTPIPSPSRARSCGAHRAHGTAWAEDNCRSCSCVNGNVSCFTQQCPRRICSRPVLAKHQCCPMCLGKHLFCCS
jgi:hypothetical protein